MRSRDLSELLRAGQSYQKQMEKDLLDVAINEGLLPEPTKLTSLEMCIYAQEITQEFAKREGRNISIEDAQAAWWRTKNRIAQMPPEEKECFSLVLEMYQSNGKVTAADLPQVWTKSRKLWQQYQKHAADAPIHPPPAPVVTEQIEPQGQAHLTPEEREWYNTLIACKQSFSTKGLSWEDIGKRRGVSGKTAQRRLKELRERGLPGLDDWPKRDN